MPDGTGPNPQPNPIGSGSHLTKDPEWDQPSMGMSISYYGAKGEEQELPRDLLKMGPVVRGTFEEVAP